MTYLHRLFGSKTKRQPKPLTQKPRQYGQLHIEQLEARITPADVTVASLLFRGDLVTDGTLWRAAGKPIEVGFNPTEGEAFKSLVTLTGDTVIDPALQNFRFKGTGALPGVSGLQDFWSSTTLSTFDVQRMTTATGESITGKALTLGDLVTTATTLALENPNGGDTTDSQLKLNGAGTLAFTGAATPLSINPLALTVTGAGAGTATGKTSGALQVQGTTWTLTANPFAATFSSGLSLATITGTASALLRTDTVSMQMDPAMDAGNGLAIEAGTIKTLGASAKDQNFTVAGTPITITGRLSLTDTALDFKGEARHTGALKFLGYSDFRFTLENAKLAGLTAYATAPWLNATAGAGIAFSFLPFPGVVSLTTKMEAKLKADPSGPETLSITGTAGFTWDRLQKSNAPSREAVTLTVTAAGDGWVIQDGVVRDWDIQVDGRLDLMSQSFELRATRLWYASNHTTYGKDTYGFSGSMYMTLGDGIRKFTDPNGNLRATEPPNYFELSLGTKEKPGFVMANGEVRRIDVAVSVKQMKAGKPLEKDGLKWKGLEFRLLNAGFIYEANSGSTVKKFGLFGVLATELGLKAGSFSGGQITTALGTRDNPGLLLTSEWDETTGAYANTFEARDLTLRFANVKLGNYGINQLEVTYKIPDKTKPEVAFWGARAELSFGPVYGGLSFKLKTVEDKTTGETTTYFDGGTLVVGSDPTGDSDGITIGTTGAFLVRLEVGVENWTDPDNWALVGSGTIGFGKRLSWADSSSTDPRKVYPVVLRGTIRYLPAARKITGNVDVFVGAYWDKMAHAANQEGWKPLLGSGKGTFIVDWANDIYAKVDFKGNLFQLVQGELQFLHKKGELLFYASVRIEPTPYGIWDFWPVNRINIGASVFLLLAERQKVFAAWTQIKIVGINQTLGFGYDFLNSDAYWILSDGKVNELIALKDSYLNPTTTDPFKYNQTYQIKADKDSTAFYSSSYTVNIPFVTQEINAYNPYLGRDITYAKSLTSSDIRVSIPTEGANALPAGASYTSRISMNPIQTNWMGTQYQTGSIIVNIFPNADERTNFTKTFAKLGIDKLMVDIKVGLKQNSMFFHSGLDNPETESYVQTLKQWGPSGKWKPSGGLLSNISTIDILYPYANAVWDNTKTVQYWSTSKQVWIDAPILPTQFNTFQIAPPVIGEASIPFDDSATNTISFAFLANRSPQTYNNCTASLMIAEEAEIAANRWIVQRTGGWKSRDQLSDEGGVDPQYDSNSTYHAVGWVVERDSFDQFEITSQKVETPYAGTIGSEVLFFDGDRVARVGVVKSFGADGTSVQIQMGQIETGAVTWSVASNQVKDLWVKRAKVQLLSNSNAGSVGDVFTAANNTKGYSEKVPDFYNPTNPPKIYYEAFSLDQQVVSGVMPPLPPGNITPEMLKLPSLPSYVTNLMELNNPLNVYYPLDQSKNLAVLDQFVTANLADSSGHPTSETARVLWKDLKTMPYKFNWTEQGLSPTPKYAFLMVDDTINQPGFGNFQRFVPSVQLKGKAQVTDNINPPLPYAGLTVFLDANNNGQFDQAEAYNDANGNGQFDPGPGETFTDVNGNGNYDPAEPFVDIDGNKKFDPGETYNDTNGNGKYDAAEPFVDANANGRCDPRENFLDFNGNGVRDTLTEVSTTTNAAGEYYFYGIEPGTYHVGFALPGNRLPASGSSILEVNRASEQTTEAPDFIARWSNPTLSGQLFVDANQNNKRDPGEVGAAGARLVLTDKDGAPIIGSNGLPLVAFTNFDGNYSITLYEEYGAAVRLQLEGTADIAGVTIVATGEGGDSKLFTGIDYDKPAHFIHNFAVQSKIRFVADPNASLLQNLASYLMLFLDGQYSGVDFETSGFEFHVDRFKLLPITGNEQGLQSAKGRAVFGGQTLGFEFVGPRGLVVAGNKLREINLRLTGDLEIFGAKLNLDNLTGRFVAGDPANGTSDSFQLNGTTTLKMGGATVTVALPATGLVLSDRGIESLNVLFTGSLTISGAEVDLGSLKAAYNREANKLVLTGETTLLALESGDERNTLGLDRVLIEIAGGKVTRFQATLAGSFKVAGVEWDVARLSFSWLAEEDKFSISGSSNLKTKDEKVQLVAQLPGNGIVYSKSGLQLHAKVSGQVILAGDSDAPTTLSLDALDIQYADKVLQIIGATSLTIDDSEVALANLNLKLANGVIEIVAASAGGAITLGKTILKLGPVNQFQYDGKTKLMGLAGDATLEWRPAGNATGENSGDDTILGVKGSITIKERKVAVISATIITGEMKIAGAPLRLDSMTLNYDRSTDLFAITGSATLELLGGKITASFPSPGIIWSQGIFDTLSFGLSGYLPIRVDTSGEPSFSVRVEDLTANYSPKDATLTLKGLASVRRGKSEGILETDPAGLVIVHNQLNNFSGFLSLDLAFGGESYTDTNKNLVWDKDESYTDENNNKKYDDGMSLQVDRAGLAYQRATSSTQSHILVTGMGVLDFDGSGPSRDGVHLDLSNPGIELVGGELENFAVSVSAAFELKSLNFKPVSLGLKYDRSQKEIGLFGGVGIEVDSNAFGFTLGTGFDNPGLRFQSGALTYVSAALTGEFKLGDLKLEAQNAGFTFDSANDSWAIFGKAKISNVFSVSVGLGTAANPGLLIRDNDWNISNLNLGLSEIHIGGFVLNKAIMTINRVENVWSYYTACEVTLPIGGEIGARGEFSLVAGKVDLISVALASETGINIPNTPLFINFLSGGIRNLSNLSQVTLTGSIGVGLGTTVKILGKNALTAQFVGSFTMDPKSLKIHVDAYLGAVNSGTLANPAWKGLLAKGTGVMFLDWSQRIYSADLNLSFLAGTFVTRGTLYFSKANGMVLSSTANLSVPKEVPIIGGLSLASANFLFVYNPAKDRFYAMGWGEVALLGTRGLKYNVLTDSFSVVNEDDIKADLASAATPRAMVLSMPRQDTPFLRSAGVLQSPIGPRFIALGTLDTLDQPWSYSGVSTAIPVTEVSDGTYVARFRVNDPARWAGFNAWQNGMAFEADPVLGVEMSKIPLEFDPATGLGSIGIRLSPLPGQYLPRGLVLRSRLLSPVELTGTLGSGDPDLESGWNQAFAYGGRTPPVGFDKEFNAPPDGLRVRSGRFTVSYRPVVDATGQLPDDWVESLRLYLDPVEGIRFTISAPLFDENLQQGCMVITATKVDGSYLDNGLRFSGVIRSKVALGNPEDKDGLNQQGEIRPLLSIRWETDPPVVDIPVISPTIASGIQTTTLTGRINDLRLKEVYVSLFYSTDYEGNEEHIASDPAGNPVESIPVAVNPDGTWSTKVTWDSSGLPSGDLWLYGLVKKGPGRTPVYGESAGPFRVTHSVSGTITDPAGGYSGVPVFADLNGDGSWQTDEPRAISDFGGAYAFDLPAALVSARIVFAIPDYFTPVAGASALKWVDLSGGPVVENLALVPTKTIVRGSAFVSENMVIDQSTGAQGRPVSGLTVILTGPGGIILRATTNNLGRYAIPVEVAGDYALTLDVVNSAYLGFQLAELSQTPLVRHIAIPQNAPGIVRMDPVHVESIGLVNTFAPRGMGSLASLVDLSDKGFVSTIRFDASMRGATIDISLPDNSPAQPYYLWDSASGQWILVSPPIAEELRYGDTAFILSSDLRIDGGDLGITLREAAAADDPDAGYRAFYVQPGVRFLLENITIQGFTSKGQPGNPGVTGESTVSGGGAARGGGGAILNRGATTLNNVHLINNTALGGRGGDAPVPIYLVQPDNPGQAGLPLGTNGTSQKGGNGGGYKGGIGGQAFPVTITYTLGNDPTPLTATVMIAGAGGGGAGLGGAIYNGKGASLTIGGGSTFTGNSASGGKGGVGSPEFLTNLANVLFGDSARTLSVTGFEAWELSQGNDGAGLGGAIYNNGGTVRVADSVFSGNFSTDGGAALYSTKGSTVINTSAFRDNSSGQDQGIRFEGGDITQGVFELNRSMVLAGGNDPKALVASGGRRFGEGNIVSSQTGFAWGVLASSVVARPDSPFTGKPYIPASDGAPVAFGAPVTFTTDTRVRANPRQPFSITTTVNNPSGVGVPGGRVVLGLAGQPVGEGLLNADGSVSVAAPGLKAGRYAFDVYYEGDSIFAGSLGKTSVTVGSTTERIVEELYETHLGRESDASGLKAWSARIDGGLSVEEAVRAFRSSTEAGLKTVERVYQDLLNRLPDQVGRDNWLRFLQTGKTERDLRAQVLSSREFTSSHSREEVVNRLYETYLGREADSAGMANWLARWDAGVDAGAISLAIGSSNEAREVVVDELYQQILAREADQVGRKAWAGALANGMSQDQFEEKLLHSKEFAG